MVLWCRSLLVGAALSLVLAGAGAARGGPEHCPTLPARAGFAWLYQEGPDFELCYALSAKDDRGYIGVYLGYQPNFDPIEAVPIESGTVGQRAVFWYEARPNSSAFTVARQTLMSGPSGPDGSAFKIHLWVHAASDQAMTDLLSLLGTLKFGPER